MCLATARLLSHLLQGKLRNKERTEEGSSGNVLKRGFNQEAEKCKNRPGEPWSNPPAHQISSVSEGTHVPSHRVRMPLSGKEVGAPPSSVLHSHHSHSTGCTEPERVRKAGTMARKVRNRPRSLTARPVSHRSRGIYTLLNDDDSGHSVEQREKA